MKTSKHLLLGFAFLFCFSFASAQEMKAEKYENLEWYSISYFKWEDGKAEDAKKIINEYFKPTRQDIGSQSLIMEVDLLYSEWDYMVVFPMEDGLEEFEWKTSPRNVQWNQAFLKRAGSEEKVNEIQQKFWSYVKDSKSQLARKYN